MIRDRLTLPWLAGFFDGEGSVCCTRNKQGWRIIVTITQNDIALLEAIKVNFPEFKFSNVRKRSKTKGHDISIESSKCSVFLEAIRPFVIRTLQWPGRPHSGASADCFAISISDFL